MSDKGQTPELFLEQLALGELPPAVRRSLALSSTDRARLEALRDSNAAILDAHPPERMTVEIRKRLQRRVEFRRAPLLSWALASAGAAAAALLFIVLSWPPGQPSLERAKGDPQLFIHRQIETGGSIELQRGDTVRQGDLLQIEYNAHGKAHGVILSVDGRGTVSLHLPGEPGESTALPGGGVHSLPHAAELDDAPELERFFFVTSDVPIDVEAVLAAARRLGGDAQRKLELPSHLSQTDLLLKKPPAGLR